MTVTAADSTLLAIRKKVRRLTASADESSLPTSQIDKYINTFYSQDFLYGIKTDQMRAVYTFYTEPYRDRYPLDVYYNQGVRAPFYVDGILGFFTKERQQFYANWPSLPTSLQPVSGDSSSVIFNFVVPGPFLSQTVVVGVTATNGSPITISDDGDGNLHYRFPNPVTSVPASNTNPAIPGMINRNTGNPGLNNSILVGSVNYVTGGFSIDLTPTGLIPASEPFTVRVSQYEPGKPYSLLFWNNEFHIRPVPKKIHKCTIETYLTPVQFMQTTDIPIINQWWQLIAIGAAIKVLEDRQDMEGVGALEVLYKKQEDLTLERQATEEIFQPNQTIFNSSTPLYGSQYGWGCWS